MLKVGSIVIVTLFCEYVLYVLVNVYRLRSKTNITKQVVLLKLLVTKGWLKYIPFTVYSGNSKIL